MLWDVNPTFAFDRLNVGTDLADGVSEWSYASFDHTTYLVSSSEKFIGMFCPQLLHEVLHCVCAFVKFSKFGVSLAEYNLPAASLGIRENSGRGKPLLEIVAVLFSVDEGPNLIFGGLDLWMVYCAVGGGVVEMSFISDVPS